MLNAKALYLTLKKTRISTYPQRLDLNVSPTQGQFRWQASLNFACPKDNQANFDLTMLPSKTVTMSTKTHTSYKYFKNVFHMYNNATF